MFLKEVSYAHQVCLYLINDIAKAVKYFYIIYLKWQFSIVINFKM